MGDGRWRRRDQALRMLPHQHRGRLVAVEPARVFELVAVDDDLARDRLRMAADHQRGGKRPWLRARNSARGRSEFRLLPASRAAPPPRCFRPARRSPRGTNRNWRRSAPERPSRQWSPSNASMITTGSVRGKCCALHCGQSRRQPALRDGGRRAAIGAKAMPRVPMQQRLGFGERAADDRASTRPCTAIDRRSVTTKPSRVFRLSANCGSSPTPKRGASSCKPEEERLRLVRERADFRAREHGVETVTRFLQHDPFAADDIMQAGFALAAKTQASASSPRFSAARSSGEFA